MVRRSGTRRPHHRQPDPAQDPRLITSRGGTFRIKRDHDRPGPARSELRRWSRSTAPDGRDARRDPGPDRRPRGRADPPGRLPAGRGRHRRRLSRRLLQHHQPARPRSASAGKWIAGRPTRRWTAASLVDPAAERGPLRADDRGRARADDRRRPRRRARLSRGASRGQRTPSSSWTAPSRPRSPRAWPSARSPRADAAAPRGGGKTLVVGGPAIVHTGSGELLCSS